MRKFNSCSINGAIAGKGQGYNTYNADKCTLFIPIFIDFREILNISIFTVSTFNNIH